ncbi:MAG: cell division protein ZapB [Azoarcus sp.]|nr:cell division protein ZapB [Azoarcus sp.]
MALNHTLSNTAPLPIFTSLLSMDAELNRLEAQIEQLITMYTALRDENRELRAHKSRLETENRQLMHKIDLTAEKLEAVLDRLPQ